MIDIEVLRLAVGGHIGAVLTSADGENKVSARLRELEVDPESLASVVSAMTNARLPELGAYPDTLYSSGLIDGFILGVVAARVEATRCI